MLDKDNLIPINANPIDLFKSWYGLASETEINDPNAMTLSTISKLNRPSTRIVLLKSFDYQGFVFYTNSNSKKGKSISLNKFASLNFHWKTQKKQVRIDGEVEVVNSNIADEYFNTRPLGSKIGAWASLQSEKLSDRSLLYKRVNEVREKYKNTTVPRPLHWNGYLVKPNLIEFWHVRPDRLHDRVEFLKSENGWESHRLFP